MLSRFKFRDWDRLGLRLFLLMWAALALSHLVAWSLAVQMRTGLEPRPMRPPLHAEAGPPPMPAHDDGFEGVGPPPRAERAPGMAMRMPTFPSLPPSSLPWHTSLVDYGVRLLIIALAAWWGSRWLARPVRRLVRAAQQLTPALAQGRAAPQLSEEVGTREVREAAAVFNRMAAELGSQFEERGLMVAAISHDLRTPLTRLRMRLETMDAAPALRERSVADIREMNGLIDTVLALFRSQTQAAEPLQDTDIDALLQALSDDLVEQGQPVAYTAAPAIARARPLALRRVLGNLLGNALRYGGGADIRVESRGRQVCIPPAQLEAVFQPFYRLEGSRSRDTGGMGLGLYIARDLMQRQGGSLQLINRPEGGLRAELLLPLATPG